MEKETTAGYGSLDAERMLRPYIGKQVITEMVKWGQQKNFK